jgi:hypothetical protein
MKPVNWNYAWETTAMRKAQKAYLNQGLHNMLTISQDPNHAHKEYVLDDSNF